MKNRCNFYDHYHSFGDDLLAQAHGVGALAERTGLLRHALRALV